MHTLIVGMTGSGKTTAAKKIAGDYSRAGFQVGVLDPHLTNWPCNYITTDREYFLSYSKKEKNCLLIIDEAGEMIGRYGATMNWFATQSRHHGHQCLFLSQRARMVDITTRTNCHNAIVFEQPPHDSDILRDDFNCPEFSTAWGLQPGTALVKFKGKACFQWKIW